MSDASLDAAYNYGGGNMGSAGGGNIFQRLRGFRDSVSQHNPGLDHRAVRELGAAAVNLETIKQHHKTTRLGMRLEHPVTVMESASKLGAKSVQADGKGAIAATFGAAPRTRAATPRTASAKAPAAKAPAAKTSMPQGTTTKKPATKVEVPSGERSTPSVAGKAGTRAKAAITAKPATQRRAIKSA